MGSNVVDLIERRHRVLLHGIDVGVLHQRGDYTRFVWDEQYWARSRRRVLSLAFEDRPAVSVAAALRLPPWFSNLLPEGQLRDWIAADRGVSPVREMELLAQIGHDLPGAVQVLADGEAADPGDVRPDADAELADGPRAQATRPDAWRFSLAGVGLKFSLLAAGERLTLPAGGEGGDWIVKMPDAAYPGVPVNEHAMMSLAREVGIDVPEIRLLDRGELPPLPPAAWPNHEHLAYAIRRFDRGPARELIHMEDLAQVRGFYPVDKYKGSFETVAALVFRRRDTRALREFTRRLAFSVLVGNGDMHLKNVSLIYPDGYIPTLSPAYDLVSTAPYRDRQFGAEDLGLRLVRSRRFEDVSLGSFALLGERLGAESARLDHVAADTAERARDAWADARGRLDGLPFVQAWLDDFLPMTAERLLRGRSVGDA